MLVALSLAGLSYAKVFAQDHCVESPDAIYFGGTILTLADDAAPVEAIATKADTIVAVGSSADLLARVADGCGVRRIDLQGNTLLPGFIDSHNHWMSWAEHICSVSGETTYPPLTDIFPMISANGWTSITELNFGRPDFVPGILQDALNLDAAGQLSVRVNGYWGTYDDPAMINALADAGQTPTTFYTDRIRARGVKMYVDDPFGGADILMQERVNELVRIAHEAGWAVAAHAVNESAVEMTLSAFEAVLGDDTNDATRHRIEHAVKVSDDQLERMTAKGIITSFQMLGPADWPTQSDFGLRFLRDNREWVMRWSDMVEAQARGLKITGSSDAPFNDAPCNYSPFEIMYQAVTRDGYADRTPADWELDQRISIESALRLLTINGAYATKEEDLKGSLETGKWADFAIVSENPLAVASPEDLRSIEVVATFVGGSAEYCNAALLSAACSAEASFATSQGQVTASAYLDDQTPDLAFDGDEGTNWGAGAGPPQWIRVEFEEPIQIAAVDLVTEQSPAGRTVHAVWARTDPTADFRFVAAVDEETDTGQRITIPIPPNRPPYQSIEVRTTSSPSWVSWREIVVRDANAVSADDDAVPTTPVVLTTFPNPVHSTTVIEVQSEPGSPAVLEVFDVHGRQIRNWRLDGQSSIYRLNWDATHRDGSPVASGTYLVKLTRDGAVATTSVTIVR